MELEDFDFMHCPTCGSELLDGDMELEVEGEITYFKGFYCAACEEQNQIVLDYNEQQANNKYRRTHGLLTPDSIRSIREHLGVEAKDLSKIMGFPEDYYGFWEDGEMPTKAQSNFIRLMRRGQNYAFLAALHSSVKEKEFIRRKCPKEEDFIDRSLMYHEDDTELF